MYGKEYLDWKECWALVNEAIDQVLEESIKWYYGHYWYEIM